MMKEIVTSLPWWEMTPDQGLFATGIGSERTLNAAMRSVRETAALVYLSSQMHVHAPPRPDPVRRACA